jgi:hypothetical protein
MILKWSHFKSRKKFRTSSKAIRRVLPCPAARKKGRVRARGREGRNFHAFSIFSIKLHNETWNYSMAIITHCIATQL